MPRFPLKARAIPCLVAFALAAGGRAGADTLKVATTPAGATVMVDGAEKCVTPCDLKFPGDYFHKPHTIFSPRLEHSMMMKLTKAGFRVREIQLTDGPFAWTDLRGRKHGDYYVLRVASVDVPLDPLPATMSDAHEEVEHAGPMRPTYARTYANPASQPPEKAAERGMAQGAMIRIESDPEGAEIYFDGNFVGQTPAVMPVDDGWHRVVLKALGKKDWEKELVVAKGSQLTLHPLLEAATAKPE